MEFTFNSLQTILFLIFLLFIDDKIRKRFQFFRKAFVPSLFIGGCLISFLNFLFADIVVIIFDQSPSTLLVTLFFVSIGLRYTKQSFLEGVGKQILFLILAVCIAMCQNLFIIIWAHIFPIANDSIMMHGSMMLMGDAELSMKLMTKEYMEILSGIETFTVIFGTVACSFTFMMLSKRVDRFDTIWYEIEDKSRKNLIIHVIVFGIITGVSFGLSRICIFSFLLVNGIAYILGLFIRWGLDKYQIYKIDNGYVNKLGNYFLSMFISFIKRLLLQFMFQQHWWATV